MKGGELNAWIKFLISTAIRGARVGMLCLMGPSANMPKYSFKVRQRWRILYLSMIDRKMNRIPSGSSSPSDRVLRENGIDNVYPSAP